MMRMIVLEEKDALSLLLLTASEHANCRTDGLMEGGRDGGRERAVGALGSCLLRRGERILKQGRGAGEDYVVLL